MGTWEPLAHLVSLCLWSINTLFMGTPGITRVDFSSSLSHISSSGGKKYTQSSKLFHTKSKTSWTVRLKSYSFSFGEGMGRNRWCWGGMIKGQRDGLVLKQIISADFLSSKDYWEHFSVFGEISQNIPASLCILYIINSFLLSLRILVLNERDHQPHLWSSLQRKQNKMYSLGKGTVS